MCLTVAVVGYVLGARGTVAMPFVEPQAEVTALAHVGYALRQEELPQDWAAWQQLHDDIEAVRRGWPETERLVFDLVIAVHGLESLGQPDLELAKRLCGRLAWPECDEPALERLRDRGAP